MNPDVTLSRRSSASSLHSKASDDTRPPAPKQEVEEQSAAGGSKGPQGLSPLRPQNQSSSAGTSKAVQPKPLARTQSQDDEIRFASETVEVSDAGGATSVVHPEDIRQIEVAKDDLSPADHVKEMQSASADINAWITKEVDVESFAQVLDRNRPQRSKPRAESEGVEKSWIRKATPESVERAAERKGIYYNTPSGSDLVGKVTSDDLDQIRTAVGWSENDKKNYASNNRKSTMFATIVPSLTTWASYGGGQIAAHEHPDFKQASTAVGGPIAGLRVLATGLSQTTPVALGQHIRGTQNQEPKINKKEISDLPYAKSTSRETARRTKQLKGDARFGSFETKLQEIEERGRGTRRAADDQPGDQPGAVDMTDTNSLRGKLEQMSEESRTEFVASALGFVELAKPADSLRKKEAQGLTADHVENRHAIGNRIQAIGRGANPFLNSLSNLGAAKSPELAKELSTGFFKGIGHLSFTGVAITEAVVWAGSSGAAGLFAALDENNKAEWMEKESIVSDTNVIKAEFRDEVIGGLRPITGEVIDKKAAKKWYEPGPVTVFNEATKMVKKAISEKEKDNETNIKAGKRKEGEKDDQLDSLKRQLAIMEKRDENGAIDLSKLKKGDIFPNLYSDIHRSLFGQLIDPKSKAWSAVRDKYSVQEAVVQVDQKGAQNVNAGLGQMTTSWVPRFVVGEIGEDGAKDVNPAIQIGLSLAVSAPATLAALSQHPAIQEKNHLRAIKDELKRIAGLEDPSNDPDKPDVTDDDMKGGYGRMFGRASTAVVSQFWNNPIRNKNRDAAEAALKEYTQMGQMAVNAVLHSGTDDQKAQMQSVKSELTRMGISLEAPV